MYKLRAISFILVFLLTGLYSNAEGRWEFTPACRNVYNQLIALKIPLAQSRLDILKKQDPENLVIFFLENYADFFELFLNEDPAQYRVRWPRFLKRLEELKSIPPSSPFHDFALGVGEFQAAAIQVKFDNNWDAGWRYRASLLHMRAAKKTFPDFQPAVFYYNIMSAVAGTIPEGYKWLASLFGVKGELKSGIHNAGLIFIQNDEWSLLFRNEACFLFAYMKFHVANQKNEAVEFIQKTCPDLRSQHLLSYLAANLNINNQHPLEGLAFIKNRVRSPDYFDMPLWELESGNALIAKQPEASIQAYKNFINRFPGNFYIKGALMKLAWLNFLKGNLEEAENNRIEVLSKGSASTEADRLALKEARQNTWPHPLLLKSRLLSDGGFYKEALDVLIGKRMVDFEKENDRLEFLYRTGRIYDAIDRKDDALFFYQNAYLKGKGKREYFAARAALQSGLIFEQKNDFPNAILWFNNCLQLGEHDFKNSLDQKAKAGLLRCGYN